MMGFRDAIRAFYGRTPPADETLWHKWSVFGAFVKVTATGRWTFEPRPVWRRRHNGRWEYKLPEPETEDEWRERQW